jgi:protein SCO1/2
LSRRIWIPLLLLVVWLAGIEAGRLYSAGRSPVAGLVANPVALESGTWLSPPRPLPAFDLVDQDGNAAGPARFQGRWTLVFFGFTHCPEACPTTLALLATVRRELAGLVPADRVPDVLLVSVDPERDTPPVLKSYLAGFDPSFSGLTGNPEAVRAFATALGVPYRKIPMADGYMMDHSTAIMLVNPRGQLAALFTGPHVADVLIRDVRSSVGAS